MNKKNIIILLIIIIILLIAGIFISKNSITKSENANTEESTSETEQNEIATTIVDEQKITNTESIDYSEYLGSWYSLDGYQRLFEHDLHITYVNENILKGEIGSYRLFSADLTINMTNESSGTFYSDEFSGTVQITNENYLIFVVTSTDFEYVSIDDTFEFKYHLLEKISDMKEEEHTITDAEDEEGNYETTYDYAYELVFNEKLFKNWTISKITQDVDDMASTDGDNISIEDYFSTNDYVTDYNFDFDSTYNKNYNNRDEENTLEYYISDSYVILKNESGLTELLEYYYSYEDNTYYLRQQIGDGTYYIYYE